VERGKRRRGEVEENEGGEVREGEGKMWRSERG
jgi:hypothetical protein